MEKKPEPQSVFPNGTEKKKLLVLFAGIFLILFMIAFLLVPKVRPEKREAISQTINEVISNEKIAIIPPSPTPMPFYELTVPYLRQRSYTSVLTNTQKIAETSTYTSYLSSYTSDGFRVNGFLTQPKGTMPEGGWPAVVFVHGYIPPARYQTRTQYAAYVDYLARNGFVVFKIDLRGHGSSEGEAAGGYYSSDYVIDTLNAVAALKASDFVADNKIGLWGHSMAGNVTFRSFVAQKDAKAVVIWAGAVYTYKDMQEFGIDDGSYQPPPQDSERTRKRALLRQTHGDFSEDSIFWKLVAPTNYVADSQGAVQLHHALNDSVVSIEYSRNLMKILDTTQIDHELFEYTNGGHNISGQPFTTAMQRTVEFYKRTLQ